MKHEDVKIVAVVLLVVVLMAVSYVLGEINGVSAFIQSHCMTYQFMLIDPSKYMACAIQ